MPITAEEVRKHLPDAGKLTIALVRHLTSQVLGQEAQDVLAEPYRRAQHLKKLGGSAPGC
mgnify:CR=1 FL=1